MLKVADNIRDSSEFVEHLLVMTAALVGASIVHEVTHHDLDFYFSSLLQRQIE